MTHYEQVTRQEEKDFSTTQKIMTNIFSAYNATVKIYQMPQYCNVDGRMKAIKNDNVRNYTVEIKERNIPYLEDLETLPLTCKKYCYIMSETHANEKPLIIYLVNDEKYYIFDLESLDKNQIEIKNWRIAKKQLTDQPLQYEDTPTFFIPIGLSIYNGLIS